MGTGDNRSRGGGRPDADVAAKALVRNCFTPGTNFSAWVHRIMVNHFISGVRGRVNIPT